MTIQDMLKEVLEGIGVKYLTSTEQATWGCFILFPALPSLKYMGVIVRNKEGKITIVVPESLVTLTGFKGKKFDLHHADSINKISDCLTSIVKSAENVMFSREDKDVIADAFRERLPMVWQDAAEALKNGKELHDVIEEMRNGHVLRILQRCGVDVEEWIEEFKECQHA